MCFVNEFVVIIRSGSKDKIQLQVFLPVGFFSLSKPSLEKKSLTNVETNLPTAVPQ